MKIIMNIWFLINSKNDFYFIEIPSTHFDGMSHCRLLITVRGNFPGIFYTKIEYTLFVSSTMFNIRIDQNYRLFISKGEIVYFHFKVDNNAKRLYISMTNKDKDANMYLTNDLSVSTIIFNYIIHIIFIIFYLNTCFYMPIKYRQRYLQVLLVVFSNKIIIKFWEGWLLFNWRLNSIPSFNSKGVDSSVIPK